MTQKVVLCIELLRAMRFNFMDPLKGVHTAADEVARKPPCGELRSARLIRAYYRDWRNHDCQGFTADLRCRNRKFTVLQDAHPDFESDVLRYLQSKLLCKKSKLSVEIFAAELNNVIIPAHAQLQSALLNYRCTPPASVHISNTVAWRYMVQLGFKYGALKKGFLAQSFLIINSVPMSISPCAN